MDTAEDVVREYWRLMATNDFQAVESVLGPDFTLDWPQSNERVRGAERYGRLNTEYPAHGPWRFAMNRLVASETEVVTDVTVTDGVQTARAISFFTVAQGRIRHLLEFWPEPYPTPDHRKHLVEPSPHAWPGDMGTFIPPGEGRSPGSPLPPSAGDGA